MVLIVFSNSPDFILQLFGIESSSYIGAEKLGSELKTGFWIQDTMVGSAGRSVAPSYN